MDEIDIRHLYRILVEYQRLDPLVAQEILKRILESLAEIKEK